MGRSVSPARLRKQTGRLWYCRSSELNFNQSLKRHKSQASSRSLDNIRKVVCAVPCTMKPQGDVRWHGVESMRGTDRDGLCSYRRQGGGGGWPQGHPFARFDPWGSQWHLFRKRAGCTITDGVVRCTSAVVLTSRPHTCIYERPFSCQRLDEIFLLLYLHRNVQSHIGNQGKCTTINELVH